ncbi:MAG: flagellar motor switch protein FliN [Deltaproteobacteria bacterium]|nr:flagellar motor switch protein FliN [Deltaproteobacteria bacterium]MBF0496997.1 flagellar motor switch protein FliN [Deltaproteobacteria bacterium]MBF0552119.1 flagellar motor switch protein FliN [Deltaproteobacteria bacterium]
MVSGSGDFGADFGQKDDDLEDIFSKDDGFGDFVAPDATPPGKAAAVEFRDLKEDGTVKPGSNLDFILDIPLNVSVELGRTKMQINDLLQLGQGSVIELNKLAGEPMEILVNNKLIARGEVVVVNEKFGVRLTEIITPLERIEQLR